MKLKLKPNLFLRFKKKRLKRKPNLSLSTLMKKRLLKSKKMKKPQLLISNKKKNKTRHQLKSLKRRNRKLRNLL